MGGDLGVPSICRAMLRMGFGIVEGYGSLHMLARRADRSRAELRGADNPVTNGSKAVVASAFRTAQEFLGGSMGFVRLARDHVIGVTTEQNRKDLFRLPDPLAKLESPCQNTIVFG